MSDKTKKQFLLNAAFWAAVVAVVFFFFRYVLVWLTPFVAGFLIAVLLRPVTAFITRVTRIKSRSVSFVVITAFYILVGAAVWLLILFAIAQASGFVRFLPGFYAREIQPLLLSFNVWITDIIKMLSPEAALSLNTVLTNVVRELAGLVTGYSGTVVGSLTGAVTQIPLAILTVIFTIVCSVFISADYTKVLGFFTRLFPAGAASALRDVGDFLTGTLRKMLEAYVMIFVITFAELMAGFWVLRVGNAVWLSLIIAVFDIMPFLGTGGILLPWTLFELVRGNIPRGVGLLVLYLAVTILRNIIEPRLVGQRIGLHPIVTITAMYAGLRIAGFPGFIGAPIAIIFLKYLQDKGRIDLPFFREKKPASPPMDVFDD